MAAICDPPGQRQAEEDLRSNRIRVKILDKGEALPVWEIVCRKHQGQHMQIVLGRIKVSGRSPEPSEAVALIRKVMETKAKVVRTVGHVEFIHSARFE